MGVLNKGISRRTILIGAGAGLAAIPVAGMLDSVAAAQSGRTIAYVGTYNLPGTGRGNGKGIHSFALDSTTGGLQPIEVVATDNPAWLDFSKDGKTLFAPVEIGTKPGEKGEVVAFSIDGEGKLKKLNSVSSEGGTPTHIATHPSGKYLLVANYHGGSVAVIPIGQDGSLGMLTDLQASDRPVLSGVPANNPAGNFAVSDHSGSHFHMIGTDPSGQFVIANDAGKDAVHVWKLDESTGKLTVVDVAAAPAVTPGSAPRHFAFDKSGKFLFNLHEQNSILASYAFDPATGKLQHLADVSTLPEKFSGSSMASELVLSPDARFLYAGNRLHDSIVQFEIGADGKLTQVDKVWTQGNFPRSFAFEPGGRFLYCCNQRSDNLTVFSLDQASGKLTFTDQFVSVGSPNSIVFKTL